MNPLEHAISQNGDLPRVELPTNPHDLPTPESLGLVLRHAQQLLSDYATTSLPRIVERLEQEGCSSDPNVRAQIQEELVQVGLSMRQFGALLLELGRTILTFRMGQSPIVFQDLVQKIISTNSATDVFRAVAESSARFSGHTTEDIANDLCSDDILAKEYIDMLATDISRRLLASTDQE
ncbi:uncharacterized protein LOC111011363 isoform X2 [Momordica charantia]|uniref:Uncharacterized protein LOC111011363 isoform X2 n=1 Tax=Momordica charantia TaxID=3673 RepID=A0A6J1CH42_MOMCH|nr:uncharacterized protein LOC111011363 isoform X2 [Momordica charantia]